MAAAYLSKIFIIVLIVENGSSAAQLTLKEEKKRQILLETHGFDAFVSDKFIPLNRSLPDFRSEWCKMEYGQDWSGMSVSIIICFHNEVM